LQCVRVIQDVNCNQGAAILSMLQLFCAAAPHRAPSAFLAKANC
jgi:hypothetical protein